MNKYQTGWKHEQKLKALKQKKYIFESILWLFKKGIVQIDQEIEQSKKVK